MKKLISAAAAIALIAPSVASAATASQSLSIKSAAVQPVRASAKAGKSKAQSGLIIGLLAAAGATAGIIIAIDGDDDSR